MRGEFKNRFAQGRLFKGHVRSAGFTLTEMLVTMLIMVLASTLLATGIPTAIDTYHKIINVSNAQVALSTTLTVLRGEIGLATKVETDHNRIYYLSKEGYWSSIGNPADDEPDYQGLVKQYYYMNDDGSRGDPIANSLYPIISDAAITGTEDAITGPLYVRASSLTSDSKQLQVTIQVSEGSASDAPSLARVDNYMILLRLN